MTWRWSRRKTEQAERDERIVAAEQEVAAIRERAEIVGPALERRLRRNYWGETAAAIARKEA